MQSTEIIYENLKDMSEKMIAGVDHKGLQCVLIYFTKYTTLKSSTNAKYIISQ